MHGELRLSWKETYFRRRAPIGEGITEVVNWLRQMSVEGSVARSLQAGHTIFIPPLTK